MKLKLAAIRSGADPQSPLPAMPRWLPEPLACPRCDVTYNLVADWDQAHDRFFDSEAAPLIQRLRTAVTLGHSKGHRAAQFETTGSGITAFEAPADASLNTSLKQ
jgi:hypothetical protein